jgi:capsular exopolysaccharide synthesis family protein
MDAYVAERKKVEQELAGKTAAMADLERQYGILNAKDNQNITFNQLSSISQSLETQRAQALRDKQDYEAAARTVRPEARRMSALGGAAGDVLVSADDEQMLRTQIIQLQQQISEMRQRYLPNHPAVVAAQQRLEALGAAYADALQRRYLRSKAIQDDLQKQFDDQNKRAVEVSAKMAQYARLESDADRLRRIVDTIETRIHGADLQNAAGQVDIDFFEPASTARQSHPAPRRTLALALMLGLMLGIGLALLRDWMDDRLRSADEIRSALGVPLLGLIPQMPSAASQSVSAQKVVLDPTSDVAEAYRSLRTAIYFGAPKDRSKTILITSPSPADGKTTSAANLASVMAQAGKRVLLIDADLRNPKLHAIFGVRDGWKGLSAVLCGQVELDAAIHKTAIANLDLMPCGARPHNPSELLNSPSFSEMLETLADKYDQVVIDSPPVMGLADTRIIAACCDLTLLVLRAEKSTRRMSLIARDGLAAVGAQVLGVIVNDVSRRSEGDYDSASTAYAYGDRPPVHRHSHLQPQHSERSQAQAPAAIAAQPAAAAVGQRAATRGLLEEEQDDVQLFNDE